MKSSFYSSKVVSTILKITKPTLIVDEFQVKANIHKMVLKCIHKNILFRPHFKTHQSIRIGRWFRKEGVRKITVSSVDMAKYFAEDGWTDITIAIPVNILQLDEINELASSITLGILVESTDSAQILVDKISEPLNIWIEVDQGYHRTGVQTTDEILDIAQILNTSKNLKLIGLLTHAGHSYSAKNLHDLEEIHKQSVANLVQMQKELSDQGIKPLKLSIGDTPTCTLMDDFQGIDELRPGNFVFYDLTQAHLGVCQESEIAIGLACPVIAKYPERNQVVIYGGAIHLSKEFLINSKGEKSYGKVAIIGDDKNFYSIPNSNVISLSQEHGILEMTADVIESTSIGDLLVIIPAHSCITANLYSEYVTLEGDIFPTIHFET